MDKSFKFSHQAILDSIKKFYFSLKKNEKLKKLKKIFISFALAIVFALFRAKSAFAVENYVPTFPPFGNVSYTTFLNGVKNHLIQKVLLLGDGK